MLRMNSLDCGAGLGEGFLREEKGTGYFFLYLHHTPNTGASTETARKVACPIFFPCCHAPQNGAWHIFPQSFIRYLGYQECSAHTDRYLEDLHMRILSGSCNKRIPVSW